MSTGFTTPQPSTPVQAGCSSPPRTPPELNRSRCLELESDSDEDNHNDDIEGPFSSKKRTRYSRATRLVGFEVYSKHDAQLLELDSLSLSPTAHNSPRHSSFGDSIHNSPIPRRTLLFKMSMPDLGSNFSADSGAELTTEAQLKEYTLAETYDKNQKLLDESIPDVPLISALAPLATLRAEYENGSASYVSQIDWLNGQGYTGIRRSRGDGDCFYRSLAFAYIEQLLHSSPEEKEINVASSLSVLQDTRDLVLCCGTDDFIVEDPYETFTSIIQNITTPNRKGRTLTDEQLVARFQDQGDDEDEAVAAFIVYYLRMITSAHLKAKHIEHDYFFYDSDRDMMLTPEDFCQRFVDPIGVEADQVQIVALCRELKVNLHIAYLDGRKSDSVDFHKIEEGGDRPPLVLLYRPGHYDILVKETK